MKVSATERSGIRCLMALAKAHMEGRAVTTGEVALHEGLSPQYAAKLMGMLRRAGLVISVRGVNGGVRLAVPPDRITLADAFTALSGAVLKTEDCSPDEDARDCSWASGCRLRGVWSDLSGTVEDLLSSVSVAQLVHGHVASGEAGRSRVPGTADSPV